MASALLPARGAGQAQVGTEAAALAVVEVDGTAQAGGDHLHDGQAEARSLGIVLAVEAFEEPFQRAFVHPRSLVFHPQQQDVRPLGEQAHLHPAGGEVGTVSFPTSCDAAVQPDMDRATAMLHSFWFEEARTTYRSVAERDPDCAMA